MAASMKVFGTNEVAIRIPSLLLSTFAIGLIFGLGRSLTNTRVAYIASFLFAINGIVLEVGSGRTATDHIDLVFMVMILASVWSAQKYVLNGFDWKWNVLTGVLIGLAILSKWLPALIVLPIWYSFNKHVKRKLDTFFFRDLILLLLSIIIVAAPWQLYIRAFFPLEAAWESSFNLRHIFEPLDKMSGSFFYHFNTISNNAAMQPC
jgi:4-amino-4-deoxy-L-arabinose transferase